MNKLKSKLEKRQIEGNLRCLSRKTDLVDFASNDYLGLSRSEKLKGAVLKEWDEQQMKIPLNGLGSTGSRLLTGNSTYAEELEKRIARYHGFEAGLLFNSGYMANLGLLSSVLSEKDLVFYDTYVHASTYDGIRLSKAKAFAFRHNDLKHLEKRLKSSSGKERRFVCVESLYSKDSSFAPLEELISLCYKNSAHLIVDEANAVGLFGEKGAGLCSEKKIIERVFAQIVPFSKALGTHGAIVLGSGVLKQYLLNFSRACIYTTALPLQALVAIKCAYDLLPKLNRERLHLFSLIRQFTGKISSPIQSISIGGNERVKRFSQVLADEGFDVRPLTSPTVRRGEECLRICLHAYNTEEEVQDLISSLARLKTN